MLFITSYKTIAFIYYSVIHSCHNTRCGGIADECLRLKKMALASMERMGIDYIDMYWIHNPMDVERWTPGLIPLLKSGKVKRVGVSNHNIAEIRRANEILAEAGFKVSAVQNHFSLLYRSSEKGGVLDYCRENGIEFWAYMVLEQGALSGKYNKENPLPEESDRGKKYNPVLEQLEALTNEMTAIGKKYGASCSQIGIAWAIAKGTQPIIGATKERHVIEAAEAAKIQLTAEEKNLYIFKKLDDQWLYHKH